jgi:ubiquinone/menaquinone biosynthesis C-methylase UbiE
MLSEARAQSRDPNIEYVAGDAGATGLPAATIDIVCAVQSLHWMEPSATLAEAARVLRPGGVIAAVDTRFPPAIDPDLDVAFEQFLASAQERLGEDAIPRWNKEGHLRRMAESGLFRHVREVQLHTILHGNAERFVGFALSAINARALRTLGVSDADLQLDVLRASAEQALGAEGAEWVFGYKVRLAVK